MAMAEEKLLGDPDLSKDIQTLRESILSHPEMNFQTDDEFLLRFLRAEFFDQKLSFDLIKRYYKQRKDYPALFFKLSASNSKNALSSNFQGSLPGRDHEGRRIIIINSLDFWDTQKMKVEDINRNYLLTLEKIIQNEDAQMKGFVVVFNASGLKFAHIKCLTPHLLKQTFSSCIDNFPGRYKQIHIVNENWMFSILFSIIKPFLYRDLRTLFIFHGGNHQRLHNHVSPEVLPKELGGVLDSYSNQEWNAELLENDENMREILKYGYV